MALKSLFDKRLELLKLKSVVFCLLFSARCQDAHNKTWFPIIATTGWLGTQIDMICIVFLTFVVFLAILTNKDSGD